MLPRLGILGSGIGTNMAAIADACRTGELAAEPVIVLSDVQESGILAKAKDRGIPNIYVPPGPFQSKLSDEAERVFIDSLKQSKVDWVLLAGFMRIVKSEFLRAFPERMVNIHPSLLPSFPGLNAPAQALNYGVTVTGSTVHLVDQGIDTGAIIAQEPVKILNGDTPESLNQRIKETEHRLYPMAVSELTSGKIKICGRQVSRS
ncbi:phosphoribosylglycinamide formyltransferase [bacterium]|jgi:phosphoribosylglycinamide formyltransferase 1|nr:phosphoribosylglycinamide formyltransferase [Verrucomicrobiota bacterium]MDA7497256.1 phosphoribosylglycinamide formyltransferase [bacterium]MDA7866860.1 phosphoribosylglycinamide formyltransferase [Verrucomicrobiota bacterium]